MTGDDLCDFLRDGTLLTIPGREASWHSRGWRVHGFTKRAWRRVRHLSRSARLTGLRPISQEEWDAAGPRADEICREEDALVLRKIEMVLAYEEPERRSGAQLAAFAATYGGRRD